ncbi:MAG: hypothetical protein G01um101466_645 [Parcubacteria group bacterium Gr01-1014_66]|nr:MAG: hypothetical protein G01um101466_645 [Parcubacteria group bacterium Gr01-1014_66]
MKKYKTPIIDVKKYGGKQVAIAGGHIIASGRTLEEVIRRAKMIAPQKPLSEIRIFSVPKTLSVIYHVS